MKLNAVERIRAVVTASAVSEEAVDALKSVIGPLTEAKVRTQGRMTTQVFSGKPGGLKPVERALKSLDFSVVSLTAQKVTSGARMEPDGSMTYVHYASLSGVVIVTSN